MEFNSEFYKGLVLLVAIICIALYLRRDKKEETKWREVPQIKWNDQGMATITDTAVTTTPIEKKYLMSFGDYFPTTLAGFIAHLSSNEISTILLEVSKMTGKDAEEKKKDIMRAVTIAAARYGFQIPIALVCLDARTHALYDVLQREMRMCLVEENFIHNAGLPSPAKYYVEGMILAGQVMMHYASKGPYPSVVNFLKTYRKNYKGSEKFHDESIRSMVTAYAAMTKMPIPHNYHQYDELTDALFYTSDVNKVVEEAKPHLTLVK